MAALLVSIGPVRAQMGDHKDAPASAQHEVVPRARIPSAAPRSPQEELKTFRLAPGFRIELVSAEPDVEDPVTMQFDEDGRIWVVEMRGYMNNVQAKGEDEAIGRIAVLDGMGADGRTRRTTIFADHLVMPRAVAPVAGGALVGAPPNLWFMRDSEGTGRADQVTELENNFGVPVGFGARRDLVANDPQQQPNGPLWDLDNWIYFAHYNMRLRYVRGAFQADYSPDRGQWGLTRDDAGLLYYNYNENSLYGDLIPTQYAHRNPDQPRSRATNVDLAADERVWPIRVNPGVNRGYQAGILVNGRLRQYTAACAPAIYRGDLFPEGFYGNCFVCEPAGNLVRRYILKPKASGLVAVNAYDQSEFLASTDERFRPVALCPGPDGCLYVVDMYRGVLEHRYSITSYLLNQIVSRGLEQPIHCGRIWRIVPEGVTPPPLPRLSRAAAAELVGDLASPNGWIRDTAQRLLVERASGPDAARDRAVAEETAPLLRAAAVGRGAAPLGRVDALWTLEGLGALDTPTLDAAAADSDPRVRTAAIRLSEAGLREPAAASHALARLEELAGDGSRAVRLQLALSLGEAAKPAADRVMAGLAPSDGEDPILTYSIVSGLGHRELELLAALRADPKWADLAGSRASLVRELASCVAYERQPERVGRLLVLSAAAPPVWQRELLRGLTGAAAYLAHRPVGFPAPPEALQALERSPDHEVSALSGTVERLVTWPGKPDAPQPPPPLTPGEAARFEQGRVFFNAICAACHQEHGRGQDGLAPPLVDSEYVNGPPGRLVRIALAGVHGPIDVQGVGYWLEMPPWGAMGDEQLAATLTYVRRAWGNQGSPLTPELVRQIRKATADHPDSWTAEELEKVR
ncbi:MAG TPA: c-type cytochrome [Opitutaceae bacterium]